MITKTEKIDAEVARQTRIKLHSWVLKTLMAGMRNQHENSAICLTSLLKGGGGLIMRICARCQSERVGWRLKIISVSTDC